MPLSLDGAALRLKDDDDVAVALRALEPGVPVRFADAAIEPLVAIPSGHKIALRAIPAGRARSTSTARSSAARRCRSRPASTSTSTTSRASAGRGDLAEASP